MSDCGKTTFVFGAGASLHAGYPSINEMGEKLLNWMKIPRNSDGCFSFVNTANVLEERFGNNVEKIFKGAQQAVDGLEPDSTVFANDHLPCLVEAMRQWFAEIHQANSAFEYEKFASSIVKRGDQIISFNYDVALDCQLCRYEKWAVGDGYGFHANGLPMGSSVQLLKLHGSINWFATLFGGLTSGLGTVLASNSLGSRPCFTQVDLRALGYSNLADPHLPALAASIQPMILPTSRKQFYFDTNLGKQWQPFWSRMWRKARRALQTSERVVLCGYGMYPVDKRGRRLLLQGNFPADIEVCCGDESDRIVRELRDKGRTARVAKQVFFHEWVLDNLLHHRSVDYGIGQADEARQRPL